jgi:hypothetical protein
MLLALVMACIVCTAQCRGLSRGALACINSLRLSAALHWLLRVSMTYTVIFAPQATPSQAH